MLRKIIQTTLLDNIYRKDPTTISLENYIAGITGYESAVFVVSSTMTDQVALRTHLVAPLYAVLYDARLYIAY
jgi:threonine aldolase